MRREGSGRRGCGGEGGNELTCGRRAVVIGASPVIFGDEMILPGDFVAVCDGGLEFAIDRGIRFELLVGDFDSYRGVVPEPTAGRDEFELIRLPSEKDDTDIEFAVKTLLSRGFRDFLILGGTGGRLDHTLGNLSVAARVAENGGLCTLAGDIPGETIYVFKDRGLTLEPSDGAFVSIFPWGSGEAVVTAEGFKYPLLHGRVNAAATLGVSNEFALDNAAGPSGSVSGGDSGNGAAAGNSAIPSAGSTDFRSRSPHRAIITAESGTVVVVVNRQV